MERLQKIIARSGIASRRNAEELIAAGRVQVNNKTITVMGYKASYNDIITVDGKVLTFPENKYLVMNKPRYLISARSDQFNRDTVISVLPKQYKRYNLFPVGRLDYDTKGVLLLTNDGHFSNRLVGPQSNVEKEYLVRVDGIIDSNDLRKLAAGVVIDGYKTRRCQTYLESVDRRHKSSLVGIILKEGKYHQVKKMFAAIGYDVKHLSRIRFGNITTEGLPEGSVRELTGHEVKTLLQK